MTPSGPLWSRIESHDFEPASPLNFTRRLARDKSWPLAFARGAIAEYRRFCYLACTQGEMTPSEEVDEVWHLHLTYTRDYWDNWCANTLQAQLHHDPTEGGPDQAQRFRAQYARTLLAYETVFGPPPAAYWPATHLRFRLRPRYQTLDTARRFSLPKPAWRLA